VRRAPLPTFEGQVESRHSLQPDESGRGRGGLVVAVERGGLRTVDQV
jgi:hypothetical protein